MDQVAKSAIRIVFNALDKNIQTARFVILNIIYLIAAV